MPPTPPQPSEIARLGTELEALRVFVKALAETADQKRFRPALEEHRDEHVNSMNESGKSSDEIASFIEAIDDLRDSF